MSKSIFYLVIALLMAVICQTAYASHPGASIDAKRIGRISPADGTFTDVTVSSFTSGECAQSSNGKIVGSGGACGGGSGDVESVGNCMSGACAAATTTDATFGNVQASKIGSASAADGTFTTIRATKIDATRIGTILTADASFSSIRVDTSVLVVNPVTNNVGIGTTAPATRLHVIVPDGINDPVIRMGTTTTQSNSIKISHSGSTTNALTMFVSGANNAFVTGSVAGDSGFIVTTGQQILIGESTSARMTIDGSGNVFVPTLTAQALSNEYVCADSSGMLFRSDIGCDSI